MNDVIDLIISAFCICTGTRLNNLLKACESIGMPKKIYKDLESVIEERIFMWFLYEIKGNLNYNQRRKMVGKRLSAIENFSSIKIPKNKLEPIIDLVVDYQQKIFRSREDSKDGIQDVLLSDHDDILKKQCYRCVTCGVPLKAIVRGRCSRFPDGLEPLTKPVLDHLLPFYIGGNENNYQFLCNNCNSLKNDYIGVQEDGISLSGNFIRQRYKVEKSKRKMIFWTLWYNRCCEFSQCSKSSRDSLLWVDRDKFFGPFSYGNMKVFCTDHAPQNSRWIHFGIKSKVSKK